MALLSVVALSCGRVLAAETTPVRQGLHLDVPMPPTPVVVLGVPRLAYELHLTSFAREPLVVRSVEVLDAERRTPVAVLRGEELASSLEVPGGASESGGTVIDPGRLGVLYLDLFPEPGRTPRALEHRIAYDVGEKGSAGEGVVEAARAPVRTESPVTLGPPLRGGPWAAVYHLSLTRGHRRYVYAVAGRARIPGRFAVDWVLLDEEGRKADGDDDRIGNWHGYGAEVLAVADAVVAAVRDDVAESPTRSGQPELPLADGAGNRVVLDLGAGRFAHYEHLRPGSIRVRPGERVRRGDVIAAVGYTGHSMGPHLHFHVADSDSALDAEGLPFVLERFELLGSYDDLGSIGRAPWTPRAGATEVRRHGELPAPSAVVSLEASPPTGATDPDAQLPSGHAAVRDLWSRVDRLWNARDADGFSELFTPEGTFEVVDRDQLLDGRAAIRARFGELFPGIVPEIRHRTTVRDVRAVVPGITALDGTVEIVRTASGNGAESTVLRRFAIAAVLRESGEDGWRIHFLRAFQMPAQGEGGAPPGPATEGR